MSSEARGGTSDEIKRNVRAVLLSKIGGVPLIKFGKDYKELLGQPFPFRDLGYSTLRQCLGNMQDVVRLETKADGIERLYGIADDSSFMSSFAIKAQFPEYEEKKNRDRRKKNKRGGGGNTFSTAMGQQGQKHTHSNSGSSHKQSAFASVQRNQPTQRSGPTQTLSKKYPDLMRNMKGLFGLVVQGAPTEQSQGIETLFRTVGPVADKSSYGNLLFFRFANLHHAEEVIDKFNGFQLGQYKLKVHPAKEKIPERKHNYQANTAGSSMFSTPKETTPKDNNRDVQFTGHTNNNQASLTKTISSAVKETVSQSNGQEDHISAVQTSSSQLLEKESAPPHGMTHVSRTGLFSESQSTSERHVTKNEDLSPTEEKIQEINTNLLMKMNGLGIQEGTTTTHHSNQGNGNKTMDRTQTNDVAPAIVMKSKYSDIRYEVKCNDETHPQQRPNKMRPNSLQQSDQNNSNLRHSKTRQVVEVGPSGANSRGQSSTQRRQKNAGDDYMELMIGNIANSCLEKDVKAFMASFSPRKINFIYPPGSHRCFSAVAQLSHADAERAIQTLNGNVLYGMPISVRPKKTKKTTSSSERVRNHSEGSSMSAESLASAESGKRAASSGLKVEESKPPDESGDWNDSKPMPSLADFLDRFSDV